MIERIGRAGFKTAGHLTAITLRSCFMLGGKCFATKQETLGRFQEEKIKLHY